MDNIIDYIGLFVLTFFSYGLWKEYFSVSNKMTDDQLIQRYVLLKMKGKIK